MNIARLSIYKGPQWQPNWCILGN